MNLSLCEIQVTNCSGLSSPSLPNLCLVPPLVQGSNGLQDEANRLAGKTATPRLNDFIHLKSQTSSRENMEISQEAEKSQPGFSNRCCPSLLLTCVMPVDHRCQKCSQQLLDFPPGKLVA